MNPIQYSILQTLHERPFWLTVKIQMSVYQDGNQYQETESECPECRKKYTSSESGSEERIIIPLRKELVKQGGTQFEHVLKGLQMEVENLKQSNEKKEKAINDLKRQFDYKMNHYMLQKELKKQSGEINRLREEVSQTNHSSGISPISEINAHNIRSIVREETQRFSFPQSHNPTDFHDQEMRKTQFFSKREFLSPQFKNNPLKDRLNEGLQFRSTGKANIFNIKEAKQTMKQLEDKVRYYEQQILWMRNFIVNFIRSMQGLAFKKDREQIIIPEWNLKKKAKVSWKFLKRTFKFFYDEA